jgi:uncharacterized membrane protein
MNDINDQDKLMAALAWIFWPLAIIILLVPDMKDRPFQKYHAVHSLAFSVAIVVLTIILAACTFFIGGAGACLPLLLVIAVFYWAFKSYQGEYVEVPWLTNFVKGQGWV